MSKPRLVILQWPSDLGGADTRLKDLIKLLHKEWDITCVPNDPFRLTEDVNTSFLHSYGVKYCLLDQLPQRFEGVAFSCCNFRLFSENWRIQAIKERGLKLIWANDMMWVDNSELGAMGKGLVDLVVFTSEFHRSMLLPKIQAMNVLQRHSILPNYFDSDSWFKKELHHTSGDLVIGKSSRNDWLKYPDDFPVFYERLGDDLKFDILGWSKELAEKYSWHNFDPDRWNLRMASSMSVFDWLSNIDVFMYCSNYKFIENQSRSIVEAMLSGVPVVAPRKYNFPNMVWDRRCGWLWEDEGEIKEGLELLKNPENRITFGTRARNWSLDIWGNKEEAMRNWNRCVQEVMK